MNLRFRDPFAAEVPEAIDGVLEEGCALNLRFNRWGTLLASGCQDGRVVVWDVDTRAVAAVLPAHAASVTSTAFSRCGRYLASCAADGTVAVTDVASAQPVAAFTSLPPVLVVQFHPRDCTALLATRVSAPPLVLRIDYTAHTLAPAPLTDALAATLARVDPAPLCPPPSEHDAAEQGRREKQRRRRHKWARGLGPDNGAHAAMEDTLPCYSAAYDRKGTRFYIGTTRGAFLACDAATGELIKREPLRNTSNTTTTTTTTIADAPAQATQTTQATAEAAQATAEAAAAAEEANGDDEECANVGVRTISVSRNGHFALLNCTDRCVRIFDLRAFVQVAELRDEISHQQFWRCAFSPSAEYIASCSTTGDAHDIGVWSSQGNLVRNIKGGTSDRMVDLVWHPLRPAIFSCGLSGTIYSWSAVVSEKWSVYAPTFTELEENEEYVEREDEFDFHEGDVPLLADGTPFVLHSPQQLDPPLPAARDQAAALVGSDERGADDDDAGALDIETVEPIAAYQSGSDDDEASEPQLMTIMPVLHSLVFDAPDADADEEAAAATTTSSSSSSSNCGADAAPTHTRAAQDEEEAATPPPKP